MNRSFGRDPQLRKIVADMLAAPATGASPLDVMVEDFGPEHTANPEHAANTVTVLETARIAVPLRAIGPYKLLEQIGEGGFGTVYMAEQTAPIHRKVALKLLKPGMDSREVITRFEVERQTLAMMDHPHISRILDGGTTDEGRPFFVMELVCGVPVTQYCDEARLTTEERLTLFIDICRAVQHAHQKGIIHRDLKPSNVLVTMHDDRAVPKVIDFGIAKALNQQLTDRTLFTGYHQMLGTPLYMSPEQAQMSGIDVDTRSDVYSLGVLLYELLTGTTPFLKESIKNASIDEVRRIIREQEPPRPSVRLTTLNAEARSTISDRRQVDQRRLTVELQGELDWIVMKALEKDRNRRYESASAFAHDIEMYLIDEPVIACPPNLVYRLRKSARKHKGVLTTMVLVIACLLVGTGVSLWQANEADKARRQADDRRRDEASARQAAELESQRAKKHFEVARQAVARMLTRVADQHLATIPAMKEVREDLLNDAVTLYSDLIELQPDDAQSYHERGHVHELLRAFDMAIADYEQSVRIDLDFYEGYRSLADLHSRRPDTQHRDLPAALQNVDRLLSLRPEDHAAYFLRANILARIGHKVDALRALETYKHLAPESTDKYCNISLVLRLLQDFEGAVDAARTALTIDADFAHAYAELGIALANSGRDELALPLLTQAIEATRTQEADSFFLHQLEARSDILFRMKQYEAAIADLTRVISMVPTRSYAYKRRANAYAHLGQWSNVMADLRTSLEVNPEDLSALTWIPPHMLAAAPDPHGRENYWKLVDETIERSKHATSALEVRADVLTAFGRHEEALAALQALVEQGDTRPRTLYPIAILSLEFGQCEQYRQACARMLAEYADTQVAMTADAVAWASITVWTCALAPAAIADYTPALALARRVLEEDPVNRQYLTSLGAILMRSGDYEGSREILTQALAAAENRNISAAYTRYILTLTEYHRGDETEARDQLRLANDLAESELGNSPPWNRRLTLELLRKECESLLGSSEQ